MSTRLDGGGTVELVVEVDEKESTRTRRGHGVEAVSDGEEELCAEGGTDAGAEPGPQFDEGRGGVGEVKPAVSDACVVTNDDKCTREASF